MSVEAKFVEGDISTQADLMNLYSRQIGAFGIELMGKLVTMKVLIVGMKGIGVEAAKNLILAGPKAVHIHDSQTVCIEDLGTNFYLNESHVGKPRASCVVDQLATLNPYVEVKVHSGQLNEDSWKEYHVIVYTDDSPLQHLIEANEFCHKSSPAKPFIYASNNGIASSIFSDFGPAHVVTDPNGEPTKTNVIEHITKDGVVTVAGERHGLDDGDYVKFEEVEGMIELNELKEPVSIKRVYRKERGKTVLSPNQFQLSIDISGFKDYTIGGIAQQVNVPKTISYKSLKESIVNPVCEGDFALHHMDMNKLLVANQSAQLHFAKLALWEFQNVHNMLPEVHNKAHAAEVVQIAKDILEKHKKLPDGSALVVENIDEDIVSKYSLFSRCELPGFTAFLGGVVAQEVVKFPGKFTPLRQWLHHDAVELVSDIPNDGASQGSRYDWQINIFGKAFQDKLFQQRWFLVGAGALGCEYIKGMALMGMGAKGGVVYLTDMDRIEVSNLNRQFLFRRENVGSAKSVSAAAAAKKMNHEMNIHTFEVPVGPDTEETFDDAFWSSLDGVWNALDNVKARQYTDSKCVFYEKPLLESGTLGTKANSEIILPHKTQCYSDHKEAQEDSIPMCTLRNFPHFIEHCIEWARAQFSELFADGAQDLNSLLRDREAWFEQVAKEGAAQLEKLQNTKTLYELYKNGVTFQTCVELSIKEFIKQYRDRILDLVHAFPEDARKTDKDTGADLGPFWSGEKRFPQAAILDLENELQLDYIYNTANLFAFNFGVSQTRSLEDVKVAAAKYLASVPEWKPKQGLKINLEESDNKEHKGDQDDDEVAQIAALKEFFKNEDFSQLKSLQAADFEKDDDSNYHIDYITAASNLRAWNYRIKLTTRHKCKMIAGKIIPALATTTAMITGLVELELYKVVLGLPMNKFANTNVNLAVNQFQSFEPLEPNKAKTETDPVMCTEVKPIPMGFTVWDKVVINQGDLTVEEFCKALAAAHHGVSVSLLLKHGITQKMIDEGRGQPLYNASPYLPKSMKDKQVIHFKTNLKELYLALYGALPSSRTRYLLLDGEFQDAEGNDVRIPKIVYYFK